MKASLKNLLFTIICLSGVIYLSGCSSAISVEDYMSDGVQLPKWLPPLEAMIDITSMGNSYTGKAIFCQDILCSVFQYFENVYINNATLVFQKDVQFNIIDSKRENMESIVCKIKQYKNDNN